MSTQSVFHSGRIFGGGGGGDDSNFSSCMLVDGAIISHIGHESDQFIDSHTHLLYFGLSTLKLDLGACKNLADIRSAISVYAAQNPNIPRILCRGWLQSCTDGVALATTIDDLDSRPIFIESLDLHSTWCNTAALEEMGVDGSHNLRSDHLPLDENGKPTGLLAEDAMDIYTRPHLVSVCSAEDRKNALSSAFKAYQEAGYTGVMDMAMEAVTWEALVSFREEEGIPLHLGAYWFLKPSEDEEDLAKQLDVAIQMYRKWHPSTSPDFCILGVKMACDGVVDGCTAYLSYAYGRMDSIVKPLWSAKAMDFVVKQASKAGLQCAIHAIGDKAITQAVDSIAAAGCSNARHRIEHLELATAEDAQRLGELGIIASVQPVHSDPEILEAYETLVGKHAWERAFAYQEFAQSGATLALGTDAPTASHLPFPNLYTATTRKSAMNPLSDAQLNVKNALTLSQAIVAASQGAAYSRFAEEWTGTLKSGLRADFLVVDTVWRPEKLLEARLLSTWARGRKIADMVL
ncbi:exoenzymes regulatory protein aepA precursor [Venturia nashicola]|nr:exoenzymes regulatory protein aepA precursor [Venturia nashicola]